MVNYKELEVYCKHDTPCIQMNSRVFWIRDTPSIKMDLKVNCIHDTPCIEMNLKVNCINDTPCIKMDLKVNCINDTPCIKMDLKVNCIHDTLCIEMCNVYMIHPVSRRTWIENGIHDTPCIEMKVYYIHDTLYQDELEGVGYTRIDIDFLTTSMLCRGSKPSIWQSGTIGLTRLRNSGIINFVKLTFIVI